MRFVYNSLEVKDNKRIVTVMNMESDVFYIYDYVQTYSPYYDEDKPSPDNVTSEAFLENLRKHTGKLTVRINSKGGEVGYALSIYQTLREHVGEVTTIVDGYAYSCASWLLLAGDVRQIMPGGVVMTHNPGMYVYHDSLLSFESTLSQWKVTRDSVATITADRTGQKIEDVYDMMDKQTFFGAKDAIAKGFCTSIRDGAATIPSGVSNFLPESIAKSVPEVANCDYSDLLGKTKELSQLATTKNLLKNRVDKSK